MDLSHFKSTHNILTIAAQLGITIGRNDKALCPFHDDKKPSLQFSRSKQIATCFSSKCRAGTMDVLDLVQKSRGCTLPEAIEWLKLVSPTGREQNGEPATLTNPQSQTISDSERIALLTRVYTIFQRSLVNSAPAKEYMQSRGLDHRYNHCGYNNGQWHKQLGEKDKEVCVALGLLKPWRGGYQVFGAKSLAFPLRNADDQIVSFYFRAIHKTAAHPHLYLKNRQGLYPHFVRRSPLHDEAVRSRVGGHSPASKTKTILLTESIIDAASLIELQHKGKLSEDMKILANYGTEGEREQLEAIHSCPGLEQVIICLDGDEAGRKGSQQIAEKLKSSLSVVAEKRICIST